MKGSCILSEYRGFKIFSGLIPVLLLFFLLIPELLLRGFLS